MRIIQCHVSDSLALFREGFLRRWNLEPYHDKKQPALFVGAYHGANDIIKINNHQDFKLMLFGGADIPNVRRLFKNDLHIVIDRFSYDYSLSKYFLLPKDHKFIRVPFKDYGMFNKMPLGDKIYCYQSMNSPACRVKYGYDTLGEIIEHFGKENVLLGYHGHTIEEMISDYYAPSFVNLQLNPMAGFTSVLEMAHMGRVSISNHEAPFCLKYSGVDQVISLIEMVKRNRIVADASCFLHMSDDWLNTDYWI